MKPEQFSLARERLRLTQTELGYALGVHWITVSKWERGLNTPSLLRTEIYSGVLAHKPDQVSHPRVVGRTIRKHFKSGNLLKAHAALVIYAYR